MKKLKNLIKKAAKSKVAKAAITLIPGVGDVAQVFMTDTIEKKTTTDKAGFKITEYLGGSELGSATREELVPVIIRAALVLLMLAALLGWISFEEAEQAKEFLTD